MDTFLSIHQKDILGVLSTFDRMILKGHLTSFFPDGAFTRFLLKVGVLLKDFGPYVQTVSEMLKEHAKQMAEEAGRPYLYLESAHTQASGQAKEDLAREIAQRDGVTEGLICVLAVVEPCKSFEVRGNHKTHKLEVRRRRRKCLHFYFYFIDPEFGFMHVRLQSWFPFEIQIYINGREWLARQLDQRGIGYERYDNTFTHIDDIQTAELLCDKFAHRKWPRVLNAFAHQVNPYLPKIEAAGFGSYYWVLDQIEYATDVMFRDRATLEAIYPTLLKLALQGFSAEDILRFLGRKLHGNFKGEVKSQLKRRPEGWRVKHWMKRNSLKMYDKGSVLRIETTIHNPREFKVLRVKPSRHGRQRRWCPMTKGVARLRRMALCAGQFTSQCPLPGSSSARSTPRQGDR